ncbi:unnamed protein product [Phytomonas sp. EM1]|nr:unnamed protein product [Phytomonas sp. EM1]|eukprot:CCW62933.1 unnamed protein product [Phytomonas sp. isolate EM1]
MPDPKYSHTSFSPRSFPLFSTRLQSPSIPDPKARNTCVVLSAGRQDIQRHRLQIGTQHLVEGRGIKTPRLLKSNQLLEKPRVHHLAKLPVRPRGALPIDNSFANGKREAVLVGEISTAPSAKSDPHPDSKNARCAVSSSPSKQVVSLGCAPGDRAAISSANMFTSLEEVSDMVWAPLDEKEKEYLQQCKELPDLFRCMFEEMQRVGPSKICNRGPYATAEWMLEWLTNVQGHRCNSVPGLDESLKDTTGYESESNLRALVNKDSEGIVASEVLGLSSSGGLMDIQPTNSSPQVISEPHPTVNKVAVSCSQELACTSVTSADHSPNSSTVWSIPPVVAAPTTWRGRAFPVLIQCPPPDSSGSVAAPVTTSSEDLTPFCTPKEASYLPFELRPSPKGSSKSLSEMDDQSFLNRLQCCLKRLGEEGTSESETESYSASLNATSTIPSTSRPLRSSIGIDILICSKSTNPDDPIDTADSSVLDAVKQAHGGDNHRERSPPMVHPVPLAAAGSSSGLFSVLPQAQPPRHSTDTIAPETLRMSPRTKQAGPGECGSSKSDEIPGSVRLRPPHPVQLAASAGPSAHAKGIASQRAPAPPPSPPSHSH